MCKCVFFLQISQEKIKKIFNPGALKYSSRSSIFDTHLWAGSDLRDCASCSTDTNLKRAQLATCATPHSIARPTWPSAVINQYAASPPRERMFEAGGLWVVCVHDFFACVFCLDGAAGELS